MAWTEKGPILITGATRRVGLACVERLLAKGEQVAITYRQHKPIVDSLQAQGVHCYQADFSSDKGVLSLIERLVSDWSALRAVVHNASVWPIDGGGLDNASRLLDDVLAVHVRAPYLMNMRLADLLEAGAVGEQTADIIHITDYVVEKGSVHHVAYAASKAALANMTLSFARRYAPAIKVNTIAPSLLMFNEGDSLAYREKTLKKSVMNLEPGPGVVFDALSFILNNPYMTGREIKLDGGRHIR